MKVAIAQEHALLETKLKFTGVEWAKIRPTRAPESAKSTIVRFFMIESLKRRRVIKDLGGQSIYEISSRKEGFIPILEWHTSMSKQGQADLDYVMMFMLS
jgi:hypothetical protein